MSTSLFPRSFVAHRPDTSSTPTSSQSTFHPLFRLLDDFDHYSRASDKSSPLAMKTFKPNFDVKETKDAYELHGELPGIEQKDISIEFTDADTLTLKGRVERGYTSGTNKPSATAVSTKDDKQPTVEDEDQAIARAKTEEKDPEEKYWVTERNVGEFVRSFTFPLRVDQDKVWAEMKNGVLSVVLPKAKKVEGRKIVIN